MFLLRYNDFIVLGSWSVAGFVFSGIEIQKHAKVCYHRHHSIHITHT